MNASEHEASSKLKLLSSTNGPLSNIMVSEATTNPEQGEQSLVLGVRHTTGPSATDAAASAGTLLHTRVVYKINRNYKISRGKNVMADGIYAPLK